MPAPMPAPADSGWSGRPATLGATGEGGAFLTLLADGGSPVSRWRRNGDLNEGLLSTLKALPPGYKVTEVV